MVISPIYFTCGYAMCGEVHVLLQHRRLPSTRCPAAGHASAKQMVIPKWWVLCYKIVCA